MKRQTQVRKKENINSIKNDRSKIPRKSDQNNTDFYLIKRNRKSHIFLFAYPNVTSVRDSLSKH